MKRALCIAGALLVLTLSALAACSDAQARSLAGSVAKAVQKRAMSTASRNSLAGAQTTLAARQAGKPRIVMEKPRDVIVRRSRHPELAAHVDQAQKTGQPTVLTLERKHADLRRQESLRYVKRRGNSIAGKDRDEYPPAMTREGGFNADVRYVEQKSNRGGARSIAHQVHDLPDGSRIRVIVAE